MRIAIIGAGISGLTLARELARQASVTVFEKGRGVGGRMATRRAGGFAFDHGAQCFTARTTRFRQFLEPHIADGTVARWDGRVVNLEAGQPESERMWYETHLVATPAMTGLCKALAADVAIETRTEIAPLIREGRAWRLRDSQGADHGVFDWVISTAPPAQTARLFAHHKSFANDIAGQGTQPSFALMMGFERPWWHDWVAAKVRDNPIKWISVDSSKPGRDKAGTALVVHTRRGWSERHVNDDLDAVQAELAGELEALTGISPDAADHCATHRWRYALVDSARETGPFCDPAAMLAATGDWAATSRIEEAWLAALELSKKVKHAIQVAV